MYKRQATIYGLYAVPVNSVQPSTEETTEETTEEVKPDIIPGDVNEDKRVNVFDSVALRRMLLNNLSHPVPMVVLPPSPSPADTNGNGTIEINDFTPQYVLLQYGRARRTLYLDPVQDLIISFDFKATSYSSGKRSRIS